MYEFTSRVRYSEIGPDRRMRLSALAARMQDCAIFQAESIGFGPEEWRKTKQGWIILSWQIRIHRLPSFNEALTTATWAYYFRNMRGDRNFRVTGPDGELCAEANSEWCYFDLVQQRPVRVPEAQTASFGTEPRLPGLDAPRRIELPDGPAEEKEAVAVRITDIDTNHHVNNLHYIDMALAYVPEESKVREMRVQYLKQCRLGDLIHPQIRSGSDFLTVALDDGERKPYAICEFRF